MTLEGEGHPDQALLGAASSSGPTGLSIDAVGDVEDAVLLGRGRQPGVQQAELVRVVGEGLGQRPGHVVGVHGDAPFDVVLGAAGRPVARPGVLGSAARPAPAPG